MKTFILGCASMQVALILVWMGSLIVEHTR
jgi:hypothetical protein